MHIFVSTEKGVCNCVCVYVCVGRQRVLWIKANICERLQAEQIHWESWVHAEHLYSTRMSVSVPECVCLLEGMQV